MNCMFGYGFASRYFHLMENSRERCEVSGTLTNLHPAIKTKKKGRERKKEKKTE